jgi:serine/threonine protein kinase
MPDREMPTSQPIALISDLGESRLNNNESLGRASYGNPRYQAPEIRRSHQYSTASDVYALGCLVADIAAVNWQIASNNGIISKSIPEAILGLIIDCKDPLPERRPSAAGICNTLEGIGTSGGQDDLGLMTIEPEIFQFLFSHSGNEPSGSSGGEIPL